MVLTSGSGRPGRPSNWRVGWEEGGEGVQGGGRGKRKIQKLAGRERGGRLTRGHDHGTTIYRIYT